MMNYAVSRVWIVSLSSLVFFFQAEDGIRDLTVTGVQTCALPISCRNPNAGVPGRADCYSACVIYLIPFGQRTEKRTKDTSPRRETTCPGSLSTHGCGGPQKGPWFCNQYRSGLAYVNSFDAVRPPLRRAAARKTVPRNKFRSEEHTSEL